MKYASRIALSLALSLAACQPTAPIGANDDASRSDTPVTDVPPADVPATDVPPTDVPPLDVPPADVPPTDVPPVDAPRVDVPSDGPVCSPVIATFDCGTEAIAQTICGAVRTAGRACHVCVQNTTAGGVANRWSAVETPEACGCAPPSVDPPVDAGAASCTRNADCPSGQLCEFELGCERTHGECHDNGCTSLPVAPQYCGCDGRTIQQVSACLPDRAYRSMGACPDGGAPDA